MKRQAKLMAKALDSACGRNIFGAGDRIALEEFVTDYFIQDSSEEEELALMRTVKVRLHPLFLASDRLRTAK